MPSLPPFFRDRSRRQGYWSRGGVAGESRPYAYLNFILFDDNLAMVDAGWQRVPVEAGFDPGDEGLPDQHARVAFEAPVIPEESGYIYIWACLPKPSLIALAFLAKAGKQRE